MPSARQLLRVLVAPLTLATILTVLWCALFAAHEPPFRPRGREAHLVLWVHGKEIPFFVLEVPPVSIDLSLTFTPWRDDVRLEYDLDQRALRQELRLVVDRLRKGETEPANLAALDATLGAARFPGLYARYLSAQAKAKDADVSYFVNWLIAMTLPPQLLLILATSLHWRRCPATFA